MLTAEIIIVIETFKVILDQKKKKKHLYFLRQNYVN